jgi:hypothetical protein
MRFGFVSIVGTGGKRCDVFAGDGIYVYGIGGYARIRSQTQRATHQAPSPLDATHAGNEFLCEPPKTEKSRANLLPDKYDTTPSESQIRNFK